MADIVVYRERDWLISFRKRMEAVLQKEKLPHDAWREVEVLPTFSHHLDDPLEPRLLLLPPRGRDAQLERVLLASDAKNTERVYWAAGAARVAHEMLAKPSPHRAFILGRLLERFVGWLANPGKLSADAFRRARGEQAARAGRGKKGKLAPHNELIRRALAYDRDMADRGENWLANAPRARTLPSVLKLLEYESVDLIAGGDFGPQLPLLGIDVDHDSERVEFRRTDGREKFIPFKTLADRIAKLKKQAR